MTALGPAGLPPAARALCAELGVDPEAVVAAREAAWDEGVAAAVEASRPALAARLVEARWTLASAAADGLGCWVLRRRGLRLIHSLSREDGALWAHVSLSRADRVMPSWEQVRDVWRLLYPETAGVVVIPPAASHVSRAEVAHVWGNLERPAVTDFSHGLGTI